jgi:hypothetical protein
MQTDFLKFKEQETLPQSTPWRHWQFDGFFPPSEFKRFQQRLCSVENGFKKRADDEADINYMFLPDLDLARFFIGADFCGFLEGLTGESLEIHSEGLVQLRRMDSSSPAFPNHIDSQDQRSLVCLLYLSPDWQPGRGGELCLNSTEELGPESFSKVIAPQENRLILFFSDDTHWHSVRAVKDWTRYTIVSEWIVQGVES